MMACGGNWKVATALNIANQAHAYLELTHITRTILLTVDCTVDVAVRMDDSTSDTINLTNDLRLIANSVYKIKIPLSLATRPVIHFKQLTSDPAGSIRIVER